MININRDKQTHRPMNTVNKHDYTNETDMSNESSLQMVTLLTNLYFKDQKVDIYNGLEEREQVQLIGPRNEMNHMNSAAIMLSFLISPSSSKG